MDTIQTAPQLATIAAAMSAAGFRARALNSCVVVDLTSRSVTSAEVESAMTAAGYALGIGEWSVGSYAGVAKIRRAPTHRRIR